MGNWITTKGPESDIVLSSRIRLARNIKGYHFPHIMSVDEAKKVIKECSNSIMEKSPVLAKDFHVIEMDKLSPIERSAMVEEHLISTGLAENYPKSAVLLNTDSTVSIMINEEDHIRLQVIYPGLQLKEAYEYASKLDDVIEESVDYAFDQRMGYLTACPTNIGTGIRASVMLHLPALTVTGNINGVLNAVAQVGLTIRGIYGEGSNVQGNIYQISNQVTLGLSEEEVISNLMAVTKQIVDNEKAAIEKLKESNIMQLEDTVYRSLGILKNARLLSSNECLNLISNIRLGVGMGIITDIDSTLLNEIMISIQPATLVKREGKELDSASRDIKRAEYVRERLK
ncbi:MAG TPA: protein arginine kinase [Clostridiaceae bacterium]|nr:protein arginine kinase [Clostridiaceae bacterium]